MVNGATLKQLNNHCNQFTDKKECCGQAFL